MPPQTDALSHVVLDASESAHALRARARAAMLHGSAKLRPGAPADLVLHASHTRGRTARRAVSSLALCIALAAHAGVAGWAAQALSLSRSRRAAPPPAATPMQLDRVVELTPASSPPKAPPETPAPPPEVEPARRVGRRPAKAASPAPRRAATPTPAAEAVVAEAAPLDFTGFDIASGNAPRYAGGVTAGAGLGDSPVHDTPGSVAPQARGGRRGTPGTPVRLAAHSWRCPWPRAAAAMTANVQVVELRVTVETDGTVSEARLTADPGHGFGKAAIRCARRTRFEPARDASGRPRRALSPPIQVRFTQ